MSNDLTEAARQTVEALRNQQPPETNAVPDAPPLRVDHKENQRQYEETVKRTIEAFRSA